MDQRISELRARLADFQPWDADERGFLDRMRELAARGDGPCARSHFLPGHFTASAFVLSPDRTSLLLIFHGKLARWLQPGGHVDPDDGDVLASARREVHEEAGLAELELLEPAPFDLDIHDIPALKGDPAHAHFDVRFLFRARTLEVHAASDAKAARWVPLHELSLEITDRSVMRAVDKLLAEPREP